MAHVEHQLSVLLTHFYPNNTFLKLQLDVYCILYILPTIEQSRKQTGLLGNSVACIHARSCWGWISEKELSSDWTEGRKGRVSRAVAVLSDPHSSRPSYIRQLLRDIICLKTQSKHLSWSRNPFVCPTISILLCSYSLFSAMLKYDRAAINASL